MQRTPPRSIPLVAVLFSLPVLAAQEPRIADTVGVVVRKHLESERAVGLSVGVAMRGEEHAAGYGRAEAEFDSAADAATMFRIGSVTKQFTAALILRLVEQEKLGLDDTLETLLPNFDTGGRQVTVRQLLNHTSGIQSYTDLGEEWAKLHPLEIAPSELLALVSGKPFDFEPGTDWHYNNTGYYLLGLILEKVHGKPYGEVVREELCIPLGLERTRYDSNRDRIQNRAQGYDLVEGELKNDEPLGVSHPGAAGALLSTGGDLVKWARALHGGRVISAASYAAMCTPTVLPNGRDTHYGFGLIVDEFAGKPSIGHGGGIHGFNSSLLWLPNEECFVAVVCNSSLSARRVAEDIVYAVLGIERPKAEDKPIPAEILERLMGAYRIDLLELAITVQSREGKLFAQGEGQREFRLLYQGEGEFRAEFDPEVKLVWQRDGSSFALHQGGGVFEAKRTE